MLSNQIQGFSRPLTDPVNIPKGYNQKRFGLVINSESIIFIILRTDFAWILIADNFHYIHGRKTMVKI